MKVSNAPDPEKGAGSAFDELLRLQTDFQSRLAEETLRYFRQLQGVVGPAAPGTVVKPAKKLRLAARGQVSGRAELTLEVQNLQRVYCMVTPQLTPLVSSAGVTWFPGAETGGGSRLVAPDEVETLQMALPIPDDLPAGTYRGALLLLGFSDNGIPVTVTVRASRPARSPRAAAKRKSAKRKATRTAGRGAARKRSSK